MQGGARSASRGLPALFALAVALVVGYGLTSRLGPALADEYVYLAGAKHFARTGSLDARFYDTRAILAKGHPHHDVHGPGYVLLLGALTAVVKGGYGTAVALNVFAYLASCFLVHQLTRALGFGERAALGAAALYLILPAYLPFVFWAMPEVLLGTLFLGALLLAVRWGDRPWAAATAGLVLGLALLVRESAVFGAPAIIVALRDGRTRRAFLAGLALFILLVHLPLSWDRAPGGVNFWGPPADARKPGGFAPWHALRAGDLGKTIAAATRYVRSNTTGPAAPNATEMGMLAVFLALPVGALATLRSSNPVARRVLLALSVGWVSLAACIVLVFALGRWSGFRYLMFVAPAFLPWTARAADDPRPSARWAFPLAVVVACVALQVAVFRVHDEYKLSRQLRQEAIAAYVDRYIGGRPVSRIVFPNGWRFGLEHYPTEVISSLPAGGEQLRALESAVWYDYLVFPARSPLPPEPDGSLRYLRINPSGTELAIYRRLR